MKELIKTICNFIKKNWIWIVIAVLTVVIVIMWWELSKAHENEATQQEEYNELVTEYNQLAQDFDTLQDAYIGLVTIDSILYAANDSLSKSCTKLRSELDIIQKEYKKLKSSRATQRRTVPRRTQRPQRNSTPPQRNTPQRNPVNGSGNHPDLDW